MNTIQSGYAVNNTGSPSLIKQSQLSRRMLVLVKLHKHHFLGKHECLRGHQIQVSFSPGGRGDFAGTEVKYTQF